MKTVELPEVITRITYLPPWGGRHQEEVKTISGHVENVQLIVDRPGWAIGHKVHQADRSSTMQIQGSTFYSDRGIQVTRDQALRKAFVGLRNPTTTIIMEMFLKDPMLLGAFIPTGAWFPFAVHATDQVV